MKRLVLILSIASVTGGFQVIAQTAEDVFVGANDLYREGKFTEAVGAYENILSQGLVSASLYFNLGNSHYRLGNHAEAILAYERALRLDPADPDIQFNLRLANLRTIDRIEAVPELFLISWMKSLAVLFPLSVTEGILVGAWVTFFGALSFLNVFPQTSRERFLRLLAVMCLGVVVLAGGFFLVQAIEGSDKSAAIIVENVVTAKTSPDEQSVDTFVIHEGLRVRMEDTVGEWVRISLADGKVGWIPRASCEQI